jgi:formate transporter FocA
MRNQSEGFRIASMEDSTGRHEMETPPNQAFEALLPAEMAAKAEQVGIKKVNMDAERLFMLAVLAGAFIALGAAFATTVAAAADNSLPFGVARLLAGSVFSLGLILVIVGGAELFTGNNLIVMAWASKKVTTGQLLRNWAIAYVGNFVGAIATAMLVFVSGQFRFGGGSVGLVALKTAELKCNLGFLQAIALGILCNVLVCLAVWLTFSARSTADRILAIVPPISAFVAMGFEHSVANMYFVPIALFIKAWGPSTFWDAANMTADDFSHVTWSAFLMDNLLPVTIGNIIGGGLLVGTVYWFVYLNRKKTS